VDYRAHLSQVIENINNSESSGRLHKLDGLTGYSGDSIIGFLQRSLGLIADKADERCYLEVGVFQGLSLVSVGYANKNVTCYGVDNFSQLDAAGQNKNLVLERLERNGINNAKLIDKDFEEALLDFHKNDSARNIAVYFIDGPHDYRSQFLCLDFAKPSLSEGAIIVIDDANYEHVRRATADWLRANPDYALLFEAYTEAHPNHMTAEQLASARKRWWDGVHIIAHDPEHHLERILPPVDPDRTRYTNDHEVHSARHSEAASAAVALLADGFVRSILRFVKLRLSTTDQSGFPNLNTRSGGLARTTLANFKE
jgi:hypothetical protein